MHNVGLVIATLVGRAVPYTRPGTRSAIAKKPVTGPIGVDRAGMAGDEQGDTRAHGGPDKTLHLYAFEHYSDWRHDLHGSDAHDALTLLEAPGAFGENLATRGLTEEQVCIGDRLRVGSALLEVSQARQPCWKLNDRFGVRDMARRVQQTMRSGWYCRVIEPGTLQAGDAIVLLERPWPAWPLTRLMELLYRRTLDRALLREAQALPLVPSWQRVVERRLAEGTVEDWSARLDGPG